MLDRLTDALTGRRLGGALLVLSGLVVAGIVLWPGGSGDSARAPAKIVPVRLVSVPQLGLAFAYPSTWSRTVAGRVIRLRNADRDATLTFSSPVAGRYAKRLRDELKQTLRKQFAPATIVHDGPGRLGRRKALTFELQGFGPEDSVRALVVICSSPYRTYAVTLLTPSRPSAKGLAQVQQILATVRLTKPQRSIR
jgi:hypothetical protein